MLKEIFEQPTAARETILGRVSQDSGRVFLDEMKITEKQLASIDKVTILACGTSWHAGLVGKFMIEQLARVAVDVDYGSEYRYRGPIVARTRWLTSSASGETADTLAALREAKREARPASRSATSSAAWRNRRDDLHAGPEIGVASTEPLRAARRAISAAQLGQARGPIAGSVKVHVDALFNCHVLEETLKVRQSGRNRRPVSESHISVSRPWYQLSHRP
jgi:glucosamine--fructose-6-phosphate aminotransferase (isomerizing)